MADEDCTSPPAAREKQIQYQQIQDSGPAHEKQLQSHEEQQIQDSGCPPISLKASCFERLSDVLISAGTGLWALFGAITAFYTISYNVKAFVAQVQSYSPCVADSSQL